MNDAPAPIAVLFVTPECAPLVKAGGLGDVSEALPAALRAAGVDARVLLPGYESVLGGLTLSEVKRLPGGLTAGSRLLEGVLPSGVPVYVIDNPPLYRRAGGPYQDQNGRDWTDNAVRFGVLSRTAALLGSPQSPLDWRPDIVHGNDWPAGLATAYLRFGSRPAAATVFTIHNLAFQGLFSRFMLGPLELPEACFTLDGVEFHGRLSFLKAGIAYSDFVTTVSPTYAREIQTDELGCGLAGLLRVRSDRLAGIANGIDTRTWDPRNDPFIASRYDLHTLERKRANRTALQRELGLAVTDDALLVGVVSRFTEQKGIDLVAAAADELARMPVQIAAVGTGQAEIEQAMLDAARRHPGRIAVRITFDERLAHLVEAGADAFLMPSRFEPCGLNQMYSQRYGTPPIAHATGGLADTIVDCTERTLADGSATGFLFREPSADGLVAAVRRAAAVFREPRWRELQLNGMKKDFGWSLPARRYAEIYGSLASSRATAGTGGRPGSAQRV